MHLSYKTAKYKDTIPLMIAKIYYELDQIDANHRNLEDHLFRITYKKDKQSYDRVNYDLSSSYFVGIKCPISHCGHSKDDKSHNKKVLLAIMVNDKGC